MHPTLLLLFIFRCVAHLYDRKKLSSSDKGSLFTVDKSSNDEVSDTSDDATYIKAG